jgi:hypothetical protein
VRTPGCEVVSAIVVLLGFSECSNALQVLCCAGVDLICILIESELLRGA